MMMKEEVVLNDVNDTSRFQIKDACVVKMVSVVLFHLLMKLNLPAAPREPEGSLCLFLPTQAQTVN